MNFRNFRCMASRVLRSTKKSMYAYCDELSAAVMDVTLHLADS